MNSILNKDQIPDYFVAQFPGGGQRGYATVKLLQWFEETTGLPTHQLFPYVTSGSVGILIASALYLPHPDHPKAARMSARQLAELFPRIAERTPEPARFNNTNSREPFAQAIEPFIGHGKLKDFLGTVFFSSHGIGGVSKSYVVHGKCVCPITGKATYIGNADKRILDIAFAGTSLPSLFQAYEDHIDLAFAEVPANTLIEIDQLFPVGAKGAFVRVGNFRGETEESRKHLKDSGFIRQAASFAITDAISDHIYSQTIVCANKLYPGNVFNLEYEIPASYPDPPKIRADVVSEEQFQKITKMTDKFIADNLPMLTSLADALKSKALERIRHHPETAFGIPAEIQEFPLHQLSPLTRGHNKTSHAFGLAAGELTRIVSSIATHSLQNAFEIVKSEPVQAAIRDIKTIMSRRIDRWDEILLPRQLKNPAYVGTEETRPVPPPPISDHELL